MRLLSWIVVCGALLLAGASAHLFFGKTNMDPEAKVRMASEQRVAALKPEAEAGRSGAQYRLGEAYRTAPAEVRDPTLAREWYRKAADQGHIAAQYELAMLYVKGDGVPQSNVRAAEWLRLAAGLGRHQGAQFQLGELYFHGRGVGQDYGQAMNWYRKAADHGHPVAQLLVGIMFREGWGVENDDLEAYKWLTLALAHRDQVLAYDSRLDPNVEREVLLKRLNQSQVALAKKRVEEWKPAQ
jgi:TPR repeat protein